MLESKLTHAVALTLIAILSVQAASTNVIGLAILTGDTLVDHMSSRESITIMDGSTVETRVGVARLSVGSGRLTLEPASKAIVYRNRLFLEEGEAEFAGSSFHVVASGIRACAFEPNAIGRVSVRSSGLAITALENDIRVMNVAGVTLAKVLAGTTLQFSPTTSSKLADSSISGVVVIRNDRYFLTDETSNLTFELRGPGVAAKLGKRVEANGSAEEVDTIPGHKSTILHVKVIRELSQIPLKSGGTALFGGHKAWIFGVAVVVVSTTTAASTLLLNSGPGSMSPSH